MTHCLVRAAELDKARRLAAATLAQAALAPYYAALPEALARATIADGFLDCRDEVGDALVAVARDGAPVGLVAGYPLDELALRQRTALYRLMSTLPPDAAGGFVAAARALSAQVPDAGDQGHYLARVAVDAACRGSGLSGQLLEAFLDDAGSSAAVLHVHGANTRAISFYRRHGFTVTDARLDYWLMRRTATA